MNYEPDPSTNPKSFLPLRPGKGERPLRYLNPYPQELALDEGAFNLRINTGATRVPDELLAVAEELVVDLKTVSNVLVSLNTKEADPGIRMEIRDLGLSAEGYELTITAEGIHIAGQDRAGLYYGTQTLLQIAAFEQGVLPRLRIRDWPSYKWRAVMLDMGRGVYNQALIQRCIRIMARLKLNLLHLHLFDDEIMGVRFNNLELGKENPHALPIDALADIVKYARQYHVTVSPEIESWGHVNSVIYHYPECYGAPGMWGGSSFGIGARTLEILEQMYNEVVPHLEDECFVHLGMDEANWAVLPDMEGREEITPEWLVDQLYDILMTVGKRHGKKITMRLWADHGGRPIPERIRDRVIVEPWNYWELARADIEEKVQRYGKGASPFLIGAGKPAMAQNGAFGATRLWSQAARNTSNCEGVNITLWGGNLVERYLISLYAGAGYVWNAENIQEPEERDSHREILRGDLTARMMSWQTLFPDAEDSAIIRDRGPGVHVGYYVTGPDAGKPVAPTAFPVNLTVKDETQ